MLGRGRGSASLTKYHGTMDEVGEHDILQKCYSASSEVIGYIHEAQVQLTRVPRSHTRTISAHESTAHSTMRLSTQVQEPHSKAIESRT